MSLIASRKNHDSSGLFCELVSSYCLYIDNSLFVIPLLVVRCCVTLFSNPYPPEITIEAGFVEAVLSQYTSSKYKKKRPQSTKSY